MPRAARKPAPHVEAFDEKQFYLDEFRGRTLLIALADGHLRRATDYEHLSALLRTLLLNDTRVVVLVTTPTAPETEQTTRRLMRRLAPLVFRDETRPLFRDRRARTTTFWRLSASAFADAGAMTALLGGLWVTLRRGPLFIGVIAGADEASGRELARDVAARLRVHKLVLVDSAGGVRFDDGQPVSFMDEGTLEALLGAGQAEWAGLGARRPTFEVVRTALLGGVASVNVCTLGGTARELFTYEGSGTLFTLADYCAVHRLGIDQFEEVERLIERGQREGILKTRTADEIAAILVNGYGASIGTHHLAGICALITAPYAHERAGELVGLYTITRFKGEGVGARLVGRVLADARAAHLAYVFACTTEERAGSFFERQGFRRVHPPDVPAAKWKDYNPERLSRVAVFRHDVTSKRAPGGSP